MQESLRIETGTEAGDRILLVHDADAHVWRAEALGFSLGPSFALVGRALMGAIAVEAIETDRWWRPSSHQELGNHGQAAQEFARVVEGVSREATVYAKLTDDVLDLWTVIPRRDERLERAIAESMCELMRAYPHLDFDFMIFEEATPAAATIGDSGFIVVAPE